MSKYFWQYSVCKVSTCPDFIEPCILLKYETVESYPQIHKHYICPNIKLCPALLAEKVKARQVTNNIQHHRLEINTKLEGSKNARAIYKNDETSRDG